MNNIPFFSLIRKLLQSTAFTICAAFFTFATVPAHASLITNGSFETGDLSGWFVNNSPNFIDVNSFYGATDGLYSAQLGYFTNDVGVDDLRQIFTTVIGSSYAVDFDWKASHPTLQSMVFSVIGASGNLITMSVSGNGADPFDANGPFTHYTATFVADSTTTSLSFFDTSANSYAANEVLDNVSVELTPVPEPGTVALLALGLISLVSLEILRRKKN